MKIRTDYVTNSSSSSFVIGFKGDKSKWEVLRENLSDIFSDHLVDLLVESTTEIVEKKKLEELIQDEYRGWYTHDIDHTRARVAANKIRDVANQHGFDRFFIIDVSDNEIDGIVEHDIMPWLDCTLQQYSHH